MNLEQALLIVSEHYATRNAMFHSYHAQPCIMLLSLRCLHATSSH